MNDRHPLRSSRCLRRLLPLPALVLAGCLFLPVTTEIYDSDCRIAYKQMKLQQVQVGALASCHGEECAGLLAVLGATAAASAVISGSIVVVGNVVYWLEKQGRCHREN